MAKLPSGQSTLETLRDHLERNLRISVRFVPAAEVTPAGERLDGAAFLLSDELARASVRFRLARLIGMQTESVLLNEIVEGAGLASPGANTRLAKALASYFAGAVLMPYQQFRAAADELRFDIVRIGHRFDASFEQVCHRLTTLRRPGAEGVPLHFLRTDVAGNISKRFSASGLRLPRYGGACPRWIVHHAFASPGRVVSQVGRLPDGETFLCVARADVAEPGGRDTAGHHAVMIGCAIEHAHRFVYADGLDLAAVAHDRADWRHLPAVSARGLRSPRFRPGAAARRTAGGAGDITSATSICFPPPTGRQQPAGVWHESTAGRGPWPSRFSSRRMNAIWSRRCPS